jgi:hypothetical protein
MEQGVDNNSEISDSSLINKEIVLGSSNVLTFLQK